MLFQLNRSIRGLKCFYSILYLSYPIEYLEDNVQVVELPYETLRPNAPGDETNIGYQSPTEGFHWDKLDDVDPDDLATVIFAIYLDAAYRRDLYKIPPPRATGTITGITVHSRNLSVIEIPNPITGGHIKLVIKTHSMVYESAEFQNTTHDIWENFSNEWATNPYTGVAWTWEEISALQIGVSLRFAPGLGGKRASYCTLVNVTVEYGESLPGQTEEELGQPTITETVSSGSRHTESEYIPYRLVLITKRILRHVTIRVRG